MLRTGFDVIKDKNAMSLGGFDYLTKEQAAKCMLLSITIFRNNPSDWVIVREGPPFKVLVDGRNNLRHFTSVEEAIAVYANMKEPTWG